MFRTNIALLIGSEAEADFWSSDLLQFAKAYSPVRLAVEALAAAHHISVLPQHREDRNHAGNEYSLAQYTKSIAILQECLGGKAKGCTQIEKVIVLITNQLFIYLCTLLGLHSEADLHLQSGLALFYEWRPRLTEEQGSLKITPAALNFVLDAYARLDSEARIKSE